MTAPDRLDTASLDITAERIERLREDFPEVFEDGMINFDALRRSLGEWVDPGKERFGLTWPGKAACMRTIQQPSYGTLRPDRAESVDFDSTQNVIIEGENLEVLKLLQKSYYGKAKMIYIDPPYNTGQDFVYPDDYREPLANYLRLSGQTDEGGAALTTNTEAEGRYHSNWLNMMYPRLFLAKNLLREDGVIFVSIDDHEVHNLRVLMNEVFGEENFVTQITWEKGRKNDSTFFSESVEYLLVYGRDVTALKRLGKWRVKKPGLGRVLQRYGELRTQFGSDHQLIEKGMREYFQNLDHGAQELKIKHFNRSDERGLYFGADVSSASTSIPDYDILHPVTQRPVKKPSRGWGATEPVMLQRIKENRVLFGEDETTIPLKKQYLEETDVIAMTPVIYRDGRGATIVVKSLIGSEFENPKDHEVLGELFTYAGLSGHDTIIDFFAGSGSTAHAVMAENEKDGGNRRFILAQLPEPAYGKYVTIADITRERVRRVGKAIAAERAGQLDFDSTGPLDLGFRAYHLAESNIDINVRGGGSLPGTPGGAAADPVPFQIELLPDNIRPGRSDEDILTQILLSAGYELTVPVERLALGGVDVFSVQDGDLLVCLSRALTMELFEAMIAREPAQIICLDVGFGGNDALKVNVVQAIRARGKSQFRVL